MVIALMLLLVDVIQMWTEYSYFSCTSHCLMLCGHSAQYLYTRGQSNLTKSASRGANSPVRGHPRGSKVVPLNSWGRVSY